MDNSFFAYLQQLEMMAFFSGYPLLYALVIVAAGKKTGKNSFGDKAIAVLPYAYALVGTLFLGFQLKKLYPDYSFEHIKSTIQMPWLLLWGLLSVLFWIPAIGKKKVLCLIHSFVFFFFLAKDLFTQLLGALANNDMVKNDMHIYTTSLLINLGAFVVIFAASFLYERFKKSANS